MRATPARGRLEPVTGLVGQLQRVDLVTLRGADPASPGQHHRDRLAGHELGHVDGLRGGSLDDARAPRIAEGLGVALDLLAHQLAQPRLAREGLLQRVAFGRQFCLLPTDLHLLELREVAQLGLEDGLGLDVGQPEALHQDGLRLVLAADDADHLVEVEEGDQQAVEDVQPRRDLAESPLEPAPHGRLAELQPLRQHRLQAHHTRPTVEADDVHVDAIAALEVGGREQVRHQLLDVHAVGARRDDQADGLLVVALVAQVVHHRQLLGAHLRRDLLQHLGAGHLVGQRGDHHLAVLDLVHRAGTEGTAARLVHRAQLGARRDDLGAHRQVRALHVLAQVGDRRIGIVDQVDAGRGNLPEVVRRDVGGHADGNA